MIAAYMHYTVLISGYGKIILTAEDEKTLYEARFECNAGQKIGSAAASLVQPQVQILPDQPPVPEVIAAAVEWIDGYFSGRKMDCMTLPFKLSVRGTDFQRRIWRQLQLIPYGQTRSYGQLAAAAGCERGARAAGQACHNNPFILFVPCHRAVASNGSLCGFACGLEAKSALLSIEYAEKHGV